MYKLIEDNWAAERMRMRRVGGNAVVMRGSRKKFRIESGFAESRRVHL